VLLPPLLLLVLLLLVLGRLVLVLLLLYSCWVSSEMLTRMLMPTAGSSSLAVTLDKLWRRGACMKG
jgi:hypothetical protein